MTEELQKVAARSIGVLTQKHEELKRLQLEIDKYSKVKKDLVLHYIGSDEDWTENDEKIHKECYDIIESNTARIREIILNEL